MLFGYFTLFVALLIEVVGAYYSITGLAAIFSGAVVPILIMGGSLEIGKVTAAVWLKNNWHRASLQFKLYLLPAVTLLMFITSMGIFGFLSKAHNDQNLVSGDVQSKISIYDEKIKTAKENIEADRKQIKQMDDAVDQVMVRSTTEGGADKSNAIRRGQARDRTSLAKDIEANQKIISQLNDEAAPVRAEVRKVEAEVGPIKYIAKLIYGDNPDANILEKAVVWVIMMIVAVFDPLALVLILAAQQSIRWAQGKGQKEEVIEEKPVDKESGYTTTLENLEPVVDHVEVPDEYFHDPDPEEEFLVKKSRWGGFGFPMSSGFGKKENSVEVIEDEEDHYIDPVEKEARRAWKEANPNETIKEWRRRHQAGHIDNLPWMHSDYHPGLQEQLGLFPDNMPVGHAGEVKGFGISFPANPNKSDMFLRVDQLPSRLYKFNGSIWIEIDKELTDQHAYDNAYIDHLIEKISTGEYDPELLSNAERDSIEQRLKNNSRQV